ncbi:hypothetical protein E2C01_093811 [Portunus trituberculatus]|uniref:Uncharacterized protein n=1 Tax=Portunus trituberculatus TaxID=210409 RepID=A0A5B7JNQ3_PORTR|nr:hypothetical protein [Portunus trituberculatus]
MVMIRAIPEMKMVIRVGRVVEVIMTGAHHYINTQGEPDKTGSALREARRGLAQAGVRSED